jgi:23S rRNA (pseudouridine1915-N3)-methyltransferase
LTSIHAVGRLRPSLREACEEYLARLRRFGEVEVHQVREAPASERAIVQRRGEGKRLLERVPERAIVVALDRTGTGWTSEGLAAALCKWRESGRPVALVIGGSTGLDEAVTVRADHRWSLGPATLPHELARVIVLEQWYRAWTILRGEPYHK